jgi:hypothetical protein
MKRGISTKLFSKLAMSALIGTTALSSLPSFAATTVSHDGEFIYYSTPWADLSQGEQREAISLSLDYLKGQIGYLVKGTDDPKKMDLPTPSADVLDKLTQAAQKLVTVEAPGTLRYALPVGLLVYGGGSFTAALAAKVGISADIGLVIIPIKVLRVNTVTQQVSSYYDIDTSPVVVPHAHVGVGLGAGATGSVGAGLIFGKPTKASDVTGYMLSGSVSTQFIGGVDFQGTFLHNQFNGNSYFIVSGEWDWGAEAQASLDGQGGYMQPLSNVIDFLAGKKSGDTGPTVLVPENQDEGLLQQEAQHDQESAVPAPTPQPKPVPKVPSKKTKR